MNNRRRTIATGMSVVLTLLLGASCTTVKRPANTTAAAATRDPNLPVVAEEPGPVGAWGSRHTPF